MATSMIMGALGGGGGGAGIPAMGGQLLGAGLSLFGMLHANRMYKRGLDMFNNTPFPEYQIPQEVLQNQAMAQVMAMTGMPSTQYEAGLRNIGRGQTFALSNLQDRGGSIAGVNAIQQGSNDAALNLDVASAQQRLMNERGLMAENQQVASYRDKAYQVNKLQRYLMRLGMASSMMGQGSQGFNQGLNSLIESVGGAGQTVSDYGGFKNMFGGGGGASEVMGGSNPFFNLNTPEAGGSAYANAMMG